MVYQKLQYWIILLLPSDILVSSHIVGIWAADGVLATGTGSALLDALRGKAAGLTILVVVGD